MKKTLLITIIISVSMSLIGCDNSVTLKNEDEVNSKITVDQAKEIALKNANLTNDQVSFIRTETDFDNGLEKYDIEFYHENKEYDYEINAINGEIIEYDYDVENYNVSEKQEVSVNPSEITLEQAKDIALKHANLSSDQVTFVRDKIDFDNGVKKYDIEFYYENKEYDYEINAINGEIIEYDYDVENYNLSEKQEVNGNSSEITLEQAKEIVLKHASLSSDQVTFVRGEIDFDNGVKKYDIEFYHENREYDYEIDASNGSILSYERD